MRTRPRRNGVLLVFVGAIAYVLGVLVGKEASDTPDTRPGRPMVRGTDSGQDTKKAGNAQKAKEKDRARAPKIVIKQSRKGAKYSKKSRPGA